MTEQGTQAGRFRLDLEINDEEDPGYTDRLIEGLGVQHLGEQPFRVGGNFPTHRFVAEDPHHLLELAHRWVDVGGEGENLDAWEEVEIENATDGGVLTLVEDAIRRGARVFTTGTLAAIRHRAEEDGRFNLLNFSVRVTAPITWSDDQSLETGDAMRALLRGHLELVRDHVEHTHDDVKVEFEL